MVMDSIYKCANLVQRAGSFRTTIQGKRHDIGIGSLKYISLAEAREKAIEIRKAAHAGGDPLAERRAQKKAIEHEKKIPTFETAARQVYLEREATFRNAVHRKH
jgi:hypothetical protein